LNKSLIAPLLILLFSCNNSNEKSLAENAEQLGEYEVVSHNLLDQSMLQIPLDYPVGDLQNMINRILPDTLVNDSIDLNDKGDYLVLKVVPIGNLLLNSYQNNLDASLPVKALVYVKKKFAAFNIKNKKPIELKLRLDLHTILAIDETFDLSTTCTIQRIHWIENPEMRVAGIKVNLKKTINKQIEKNKDIIESAICQAIDKTVPIQKEVLAIWKLLNQTHRIAKRPIDIWLTTVPKDFSAKFDKEITDTLRVLLYAKAGILISPLKGIELAAVEKLPTNQNFKEIDRIDLRVSVNMPYEYMNLIMNSQLDGHQIEYGGFSAVLTDFKTRGDAEGIKLEFYTRGDLEINLSAMAKPTLSTERELVFNEIEYEFISQNPLVNSLDWISNGSIDSYLLEHSKVPLSHILDSLDSKILKALDRSNLSSKIDMDLKFSNIMSDTVIYYNDRFEWIFTVKGNAHALLSDNLMMKK
jgi:hypothetical protein